MDFSNRHIAPYPSSSALPTAAPTLSPSKPIADSEVETYQPPSHLPIANIARIMRQSLPSDAKISKEAKECVQECVSEFISFITSEGSDRCLQEKRKTINGEDVLWASQVLGFDNYYDALKIYLAKYRTVLNEVGKRNKRSRAEDRGEPPRKKRQTKKEKIAAAAAVEAGGGAAVPIRDNELDDEEEYEEEY